MMPHIIGGWIRTLFSCLFFVFGEGQFQKQAEQFHYRIEEYEGGERVGSEEFLATLASAAGRARHIATCMGTTETSCVLYRKEGVGWKEISRHAPVLSWHFC